MRQPLNNEIKENEEAVETTKVSQTPISQEPITITTTFTSTLSVKINQPEHKEEDKEKEEFVNFLKGFTETRRKKYSEPFVRKPLDTNKVTDLESKKEEEFTSFSDSRRGILSTPILRKRSDKKNLEKKDEEQKASLKQENTQIKMLVKMFNSLKNEPTISKTDRDIIQNNILSELQNSEKSKTGLEEVFGNITNTLTMGTLVYLNKKLGGIIAAQTDKVYNEVSVQGADDSVVDQ